MTVKCDNCGKELQTGDWPFCKGNPEDHTQQWHYGFKEIMTGKFYKDVGSRPDRTRRG